MHQAMHFVHRYLYCCCRYLPQMTSMGFTHACAEPHPALLDPADLKGRAAVTAVSIAAVTLAACTPITAALTSQYCLYRSGDSCCSHLALLQLELLAIPIVQH